MEQKKKKDGKYIEIGAAWIGDFGVNGVLKTNDFPAVDEEGKIRFYLFENKYKKADKEPDYRVMVKNPEFNGVTN